MGKRLTKKLLEILLYHPDFTNEQLAQMLDISELGIKSRIKRVNRIMGTASRAGAQITALQAGIVPLAKVKPFDLAQDKPFDPAQDKPLTPTLPNGVKIPSHIHAESSDQATGEPLGHSIRQAHRPLSIRA